MRLPSSVRQSAPLKGFVGSPSVKAVFLAFTPAVSGLAQASTFWADCVSQLGSEDPFVLWVESNCSNCEITSIKGGLRISATFWDSIASDPTLLKVVKSGYVPPFTSSPPPFWAKNNASAEEHQGFILESLAELFPNGFAELVSEQPSVVNPFSVSVRANGKKRLIANLRHLNGFLVAPKFKLDDYRTALPALRAAKFLFSFDLKKGYYHVDLDESVLDLFGFSFSFAGKTYFGCWTICTFGLSTTPYLFTKLLKPLITHWRSLGLHIFIYLDDGLALCDCRQEAAWFSHIVRSDLQSSGFHEQEVKCLWDPVTSAPWLGFEIDL